MLNKLQRANNLKTLSNALTQDAPATIRQVRNLLGLTQQALAMEMGVDISTVQTHEAGRHRPMKAIVNIYVSTFENLLAKQERVLNVQEAEDVSEGDEKALDIPGDAQ